MLPPECQVCDNFDVDLPTCCTRWVPPKMWTASRFHGDDISTFVRREYGSPSSASVDYGLFRLLNEDVRYELKSLYEDTTVWSAAFDFTGDEARLSPAPARIAQTSAFVHARVLGTFLLGYGDQNEPRPKDFGVTARKSAYFDHWRYAINTNVLHLNKRRPRATVERGGKVTYPPLNLHLEVEHLTNEIARLWRSFIREPKMGSYALLTNDIDDRAREAAAAARERLVRVFAIDAADITWRPPPK